VSLGAAESQLRSAETVVDGFWYGLSKRSWQIG
jgi:4,5-DOPA dioxygenase extradiol